MNVAIVTFSMAKNYGAVLQCYALSKFLTSKGFNVYLIEYPLEKSAKGLKSMIKNFIVTRRFSSFSAKYLPKVNNDLNPHYVIFGSDQIWNPQITKNQKFNYFGKGIKRGAKKVAYAASFGLDSWLFKDLTEEVKPLLNDFLAIGVREASGVDICLSEFNVKSQNVLDPTFLVDNYHELVDPSVNNGAVVSYFFNKDPSRYSFVSELATKLDARAVLLNELKPKKGFTVEPFPSVITWISSIKNANFIVTDSFHCMVFSILFKKNFVCFSARPDREGRLTSLLSQIGLSDRFLSSTSVEEIQKILDSPIDYNKVHNLVNQLQLFSREFLMSALEASHD